MCSTTAVCKSRWSSRCSSGTIRQAIRQDAFEMALTVQRVSQNLHSRGQGVEQIKHTLYDIVQEKVDILQSRSQKLDEFTHSVMSTLDKNAHELCSTVAKIIDEQADIRKLVEELARRKDHTQEGSIGTDAQEGPSVAIQLEVSDLKAKVLRLTEQVTQHNAKVSFFSVMSRANRSGTAKGRFQGSQGCFRQFLQSPSPNPLFPKNANSRQVTFRSLTYIKII